MRGMKGRGLLIAIVALPGLALSHEPAPGSVVTQPVFVTKPDGSELAVEEGFVFVPENRAREGSRTIPVHFLRIRAPLERRDRVPVIYLPGGPGSSVSAS